MAVSQILIALHGNYDPTGVYSFEFKSSGNGKTIAEIFFILPPESVKVTEPQRSELIPTLTGGYYVDYGNEFKDIVVSGSSHFYYAGSTRNPSKEFRSVSLLGLDDYIDGYTEFLKLRFMLSRYRDYTLTRDGKLTAPNFSGKQLASTRALKDFVSNQTVEEGALSDQIDVIFHDYDYDDHWYVRIDSVSFNRSKDDPWTVVYNIDMQAYEQDTRRFPGKALNLATERRPHPAEHIHKVYLSTGDLHLFSAPIELPIQVAGGVIPIKNLLSTEVVPIVNVRDIIGPQLPTGL